MPNCVLRHPEKSTEMLSRLTEQHLQGIGDFLGNNQMINEYWSPCRQLCEELDSFFIIPHIKVLTCWAQFVPCLLMWLYEDEKSSRKSCQTVGNHEVLSPIDKCISTKIRRFLSIFIRVLQFFCLK
jgi:hypothetical protein